MTGKESLLPMAAPIRHLLYINLTEALLCSKQSGSTALFIALRRKCTRLENACLGDCYRHAGSDARLTATRANLSA